MKLSAYTIAANCSDKSDCEAGIQEIRDYIKNREYLGYKVPAWVYIRLGKLKDKLMKCEQPNPMHPIFADALKPFGIK